MSRTPNTASTSPLVRLTGATVNEESHSVGHIERPDAVPFPAPAHRLLACADLLACPECGQDLAAQDRSLRCARGHTFDIARQGYVSLLTGAATKMTGDTPDMLDARAAFQSPGHFAPIASALAGVVADISTRTVVPAIDTARESATGPSTRPATARHARRHLATPPGATARAAARTRVAALLRTDANASGPSVLEIGAGTGYYLASMLDALPTARGIALDVSKAAARRSARAHSRAGAVLADAWRGLPVRENAIGIVVAVFAPRNASEVARVLTEDGHFIVVTPTPRHLAELIAPLDMVRVDGEKDVRLAESLGGLFELAERVPVEYSMSLTRADIANVAGMGPSAHHAAAERAERIAALPDPLPVTASVSISVYRRTTDPVEAPRTHP
ncbi:putative RNA methyltransferase [Nocardia huaxiensis]|uniref:putative RNA methyltransferase n=1 Tax=Nocardia huaxiensis TaxID=2755382 RepID=UPI001E41F33C|nr:methyltransferase domain-containing protein [Nocardia huaxiensis]UFS93449.1 methyltransferase domain-containing protein [Nocardia huaxiensis]